MKMSFGRNLFDSMERMKQEDGKVLSIKTSTTANK